MNEGIGLLAWIATFVIVLGVIVAQVIANAIGYIDQAAAF